MVSCISSSTDQRVLGSSEMPGGASTPRQLVKTRSMPASVRVGASTALDPLVAGHREHPQLAGLDLAHELAEAGEARRDLVAQQGGQRVPPPS